MGGPGTASSPKPSLPYATVVKVITITKRSYSSHSPELVERPPLHPSEICTATNRTDVWTDRHFHYHLLPGTELDRMNANFDSDHENACAWLLLNG